MLLPTGAVDGSMTWPPAGVPPSPGGPRLGPGCAPRDSRPKKAPGLNYIEPALVRPGPRSTRVSGGRGRAGGRVSWLWRSLTVSANLTKLIEIHSFWEIGQYLNITLIMSDLL